MSQSDEDLMLEGLLAAVAGGDRSAAGRLLELHRDRLSRAVALRLDTRLAARVDPSDIVQETLLDASRELVEYARERPLPFYPWLYQQAMERVTQAHRTHLHTQKRSVAREAPATFADRDESSVVLAERLVDNAPSPGAHIDREALFQRLVEALARLPDIDHEVLVMHYMEACPLVEIAAILEIGESAARMRHLRALEHIRDVMKGGSA